MINKEIEQVFKQIFIELNLPSEYVKIIKSNRPELSDYQFDGVFKIASLMKQSPEIIGNKIVTSINNLNDFSKYFSSVSFLKPGFINISLSNEFINSKLVKMYNNPKFDIKLAKKELYVIDYGGYNIAKPLHIGHLRPSIIGESIKRIVAYFGNDTIGDVHLGDYGLQIGEVIYGIKRDQLKIDDITIEYLNKIYPEISALCKSNPSINDECGEITKQLQEGNDEYQKYWHKIMAVSLEDIRKLTDYLDINFDVWEGESNAFEYFKPLETLLLNKGLLKYSEGAQVVNIKTSSDNKPMPPFIFKKSNGAYLYDSTDLATIYERKQKYNPNHILYITDFRQNLHFTQVFRVSELAGLIPFNNLEHAYNGTINGKDGKPFKTRQGDAPKLSELIKLVRETFLSLKESNKNMSQKDLDIIVNSIIKFADLQNSREKDYIFDIEKFSDVVGKTGPYILYTYVRINKIIVNNTIDTNNFSNIIYNKEDRDLRIQLLNLESSLTEAYNNRMPNYIANYIYDTCVLLNIFYQKNHLNNLDNKQNLNDWLYILNLANTIIKEMLKLLAIDVPSAM